MMTQKPTFDGLSQTARDLHEKLCQNAEGASRVFDGLTGGWRDVYLDNARPEGMSAREFAGHLSVLERHGVYRTIDGLAWGDVYDPAFAVVAE